MKLSHSSIIATWILILTSANAEPPKGLPPAVQQARERSATAMFKQWDKDGDGRVSRQELPNDKSGNFDRADSDHDGFISLSEHLAMLTRGVREGQKANALSANIDKPPTSPCQ
jgi:Ca2+-binding EF-hand superfamily protein